MANNEVVSILQYRRNAKVWVCNECETENQIDFTRCIVCGMNRQTTSRILDTWEKEQENVRQVEYSAHKEPVGEFEVGRWVNSDDTSSSYGYGPGGTSGGDQTLIKVLGAIAVAIVVIIFIAIFLNQN